MVLFFHTENQNVQPDSKQEKQWWAILYFQVLGVEICELFLWNLFLPNKFSKMNVKELALEVILHIFTLISNNLTGVQKKCWLLFVIVLH